MAAITAFGVGTAWAADTPVKLQDLPPAVQRTVREQTRNATLVGLTSEVENGKTEYELETKVNGRGRDLMIDSSGTVLSVEDEVALDSIPAPARTAIERLAAGGKIAKVEKVTEGRNVSYEAAVTRNGKRSEIAVRPDGSPVK